MKLTLISFLVPFFLLSCNPNNAQKTHLPEVKNLLGTNINLDSLDSFLHLGMERSNVRGVSIAIINNGELVYSNVKGFSDIENNILVDEHSTFEGASLSKPLFAYLCMIAVDEGILELDKPLYLYDPHNDLEHDDRNKLITARMVLSHTSGLPNWRSNGDTLKIEFDPGSSFGYSGEGYQYLAQVLAYLYKTDDEGLEKIYQTKVAEPLGLRVTKFIQDDLNLSRKVKAYRDGALIPGEEVTEEFGAAFSIHTEAKDYAQFIISLLGQKGLSKNSFEELFKPQINLPADAPHRQQGVTDWTLGFAKATLPFGNLHAHGGNNPGYTSIMALNREKKWGFVMFTNDDQSEFVLETILYLHSK